MVTNETSHDLKVLTKIPDSYEVCRLMVTNETSNDLKVLTKIPESYEFAG